jgi:signal peptidase II
MEAGLVEGTQESAESVRPQVPLSRFFLFGILAIGGLAFDLATKSYIFESVGEPSPTSVRPLIGDVLELRTSYNDGALWGFGGGWRYSSLVFAGLSLLAAGLILYWLFVRGHAADWLLTAALGLIMAGALGNCYDRIRLGHVRDFVHFHVDSIGFDFPIFNFADNMLVVGAGILMLMALRPEPRLAEEVAEGA